MPAMLPAPTLLSGLHVFEPRVFSDERGSFYESFKQSRFDAAVGLNPHTGQPYTFVQDNHSYSHRGVLRGLHFQVAPQAQGKLVRVVQGSVWDVAVDIRTASPTLGQWYGLELSASNRKQFWIPPGFAHGFIALEDHTEFLYKTTAEYDPASERAIVWNDADLGIAWPIPPTLVHLKDLEASGFQTFLKLPPLFS